MNQLIDSLLSLHARYPGMFTMLASAFKAAAVFSMAWFMVQALAHRSARARNWLWRLSLAMLLLLAGWMARPAPLQDVGFNLSVVDHTPMKVEPSLKKIALAPATPSSEVKTITVAAATQVAMPAAEALKMPAAPSWKSWLRHVDDRVVLVWLLGTALLVLVMVGRHLAARWWLARHSEKPSSSVKALCPAGMTCRMSSRVTSPLITGWLAPVVWLPVEASEWDELKLRAAFQHERAHHLRRDVFWQALGTLAACVWWWLPLSWIALRKMKAEAEHAADDVTVTQALATPDYAEALVQIARGVGLAPPPAMCVGIAMAEHSELEQRVRSLMRFNPWRDKLGALAATAMTLMMIGMSTVVLVGCKRTPPQYVSLAKMVAGGRMVSGDKAGPQYVDYLQDLYGTIIETLESAEMRRHALERVRALNPDLKETDVDIHVTQNKGSAIFNIAATGSEPKFTRAFLDALLDEFRAFREQVREQQRNKALQALAEDVVKRETANKSKAEKLAHFKENNNVIAITQGQNQAAEFLTQVNQERNRLRLQLAEIESALVNVEERLRARRAESGSASPQSSGSGFAKGVGSGDGLSQAERNYLEADRQLTEARVDVEVLSSLTPPDPARLAVAREKKTRQERLVKAYAEEMTEALKAQRSEIERRVIVLDEKADEFTRTAAEVGTTLAEYERLAKDFEDSDKAYKDMFDLVHKFQVNEEMQGDYVAIMQRASAAVEEVKPWWSF